MSHQTAEPHSDYTLAEAGLALLLAVALAAVPVGATWLNTLL